VEARDMKVSKIAMNRFLLEIPAVSAFFLAILIALSSCSKSDQSEVSDKDSSRFMEVEEITFHGHKAHIFLDKETGVKYLYIWEGGPSNGGPAITRLWEK
jgi:hypothetical protein